MKRQAIIHNAEEGGYWAEIPSLPGCITEGDTWDETVKNLQEAARAWIDVATERAMVGSEFQLVEVEV